MSCDAHAGRGHSRALSLEEALALILSETPVLGAEFVPLASVLGFVLAEDVRSDVDLPPFDRVTMDGFALRSADVAAAKASLVVTGTLHAGEVFRGRVGAGEAVRIMTGAPLPEGADCVQPVERTLEEGERVVILDAVPAGRNVAARGEDLRAGAVVLERGALVGEAEVALLSTVGAVSPLVHRRPRAAVVSTGDELVDPATKPGPGQIRNSNGPMLGVTARVLGCSDVLVLPPVRDDEALLREALALGLASDVLFVSGGVSKGEKDLVGGVLASLGVREVFHGVALQPGKPLWFGRKGDCLVFALPGNPVSSLVTARLFAGAALRKMRGLHDVGPRFVEGELVREYSRNPGRTGCLPAIVSWGARGFAVAPLDWRGSGDMVTTARANGLWIAPEGVARFEAGQRVKVLLGPDASER